MSEFDGVRTHHNSPVGLSISLQTATSSSQAVGDNDPLSVAPQGTVAQRFIIYYRGSVTAVEFVCYNFFAS